MFNLIEFQCKHWNLCSLPEDFQLFLVGHKNENQTNEQNEMNKRASKSNASKWFWNAKKKETPNHLLVYLSVGLADYFVFMRLVAFDWVKANWQRRRKKNMKRRSTLYSLFGYDINYKGKHILFIDMFEMVECHNMNI